MPTYDEQLDAYRQQLAMAAASQSASVQASQGGSTVGLAFNTLMTDLRNVGGLISQPMTPGTSSIGLRAPTYNVGFGQAFAGTFGLTNPGISMGYGEYYDIMARDLADRVGTGTTSMAATVAGVVGGLGIGSVASSIASRMGLGVGSLTRAGAGIGGRALGVVGAGMFGEGIGATLAGGAGTILGGATGIAAGIAAPIIIAAGAEAVVADVFKQMSTRRDISHTLEQQSWRFMGGRGFSENQAFNLAGSLTREGIQDRDLSLGDISTIIGRGSQLGLFTGTRDVEDFKKKFRELKENLVNITTTMKMSIEEGLQAMAELRQGGFYTPGAQTGAAMTSRGLGFGAGVSPAEMMEVGLHGATMARGTGIPTAFGFNLGQQNMFALKRMQMTGTLTPETINQFGGIVGAQESLTGQLLGLQQGPLGQRLAAYLMGPGGKGINQQVYGQLAGGAGLANAFAVGNIDPTQLNVVNAATMWGQMGTEQYQMMMGGILKGQMKWAASEFGYTDPNSQMQVAMQSVGLPINAQNVSMWTGYVNSLPQLQREMAASNLYAAQQAGNDRYLRRRAAWEQTGAGPATRWFRGNVTGRAAENLSRTGYEINLAFQRGTDWLTGIERTNLEPVNWADPDFWNSGISEGRGFAVSKNVFEIAREWGQTGKGFKGAYAWTPTTLESLPEFLAHPGSVRPNWNFVDPNAVETIRGWAGAINRGPEDIGDLGMDPQVVLNAMARGSGLRSGDILAMATRGEPIGVSQTAKYLRGLEAVRGLPQLRDASRERVLGYVMAAGGYAPKMLDQVIDEIGVNRRLDVQGAKERLLKSTWSLQVSAQNQMTTGWLGMTRRIGSTSAAIAAEALRSDPELLDAVIAYRDPNAKGGSQVKSMGIMEHRIAGMDIPTGHLGDVMEILTKYTDPKELTSIKEASRHYATMQAQSQWLQRWGEASKDVRDEGLRKEFECMARPGALTPGERAGMWAESYQKHPEWRDELKEKAPTIFAATEYALRSFEEQGGEGSVRDWVTKHPGSLAMSIQPGKLMRPANVSQQAGADATYNMLRMKDPYQAQMYQAITNTVALTESLCKERGIPTGKAQTAAKPAGGP